MTSSPYKYLLPTGPPLSYPQQSAQDLTEVSPCPKRQPRKLDYLKCSFCRKAKIKCTPTNRIWPAKCERCESKNLQCSAPTRKAQSAETLPQNQPSLMDCVVQSSAMDSGSPSQISTEEALDLLSLRYILNMAVEELRLIGETYLALTKHDTNYIFYTDRLYEVMELYNELSDLLDETLVQILEQLSFSVVKEIVRAMSLLSGPNFNRSYRHASNYSQRGHHGIASILIMKLLLANPSNVFTHARLLVDNWEAFLGRWQEAFRKSKIDQSDAYLLFQQANCDITETQLLLPRALLRVPAVLERVQKDGRRDCIGRPIPFIEHDAGLPWSFNTVTSGERDILGRSRAHILCFDGQVSFEVASEGLVQKFNEEDVCGQNHFLSRSDEDGLSPLGLAAMKGHLGIFQELHCAMPALLSKSFLTDASRNVRRTCLHWAAICGQTETVRFICSEYHVELPYGGGDFMGTTAIHLAASLNHKQVMQCLLECIVSSTTEGIGVETIDLVDDCGRTAFWRAAAEGHVDILRLLEPHVDMNRTDICKDTPLSVASCKGHTEVVRHLLGLPIGLRPDVNATNIYGETPLKQAKYMRHDDCVKLLRENGAVDDDEL